MNKICCIYIIKNETTGKFYIGSTKDFQKRKLTHLLKLSKNEHHSQILQRSYNKHGKNSFTIDIFQYCYENERLQLEQHYLDNLKPYYNVSLSASAPMQGRKHTEETKVKFRNRRQPSGKDSPHYGKKLTEEHKLKMQLKKIGSKRSDKTKNKMSETAKRINAISRIDRTTSYRKVKDNLGNIYENLSEAARINNITPMTVCDILKGRHLCTRNNIQFKYLEDDKPFINPDKLKLENKIKNCKIDLNFIKEVKREILNGLSCKDAKIKFKITKGQYYAIRKGKAFNYV